MLQFEPAEPDSSQASADRDQLERGFRRLKPEQRVAIVLHFYLGLSVPEIADTLGVPVGTVKSRLHYATLAMRATLEADARRPAAAANGRLA
jgi:RNA polymerase sigma-70 factor (ECF subfamily)